MRQALESRYHQHIDHKSTEGVLRSHFIGALSVFLFCIVGMPFCIAKLEKTHADGAAAHSTHRLHWCHSLDLTTRYRGKQGLLATQDAGSHLFNASNEHWRPCWHRLPSFSPSNRQ